MTLRPTAPTPTMALERDAFDGLVASAVARKQALSWLQQAAVCPAKRVQCVPALEQVTPITATRRLREMEEARGVRPTASTPQPFPSSSLNLLLSTPSTTALLASSMHHGRPLVGASGTVPPPPAFSPPTLPLSASSHNVLPMALRPSHAPSTGETPSSVVGGMSIKVDTRSYVPRANPFAKRQMLQIAAIDPSTTPAPGNGSSAPGLGGRAPSRGARIALNTPAIVAAAPVGQSLPPLFETDTVMGLLPALASLHTIKPSSIYAPRSQLGVNRDGLRTPHVERSAVTPAAPKEDSGNGLGLQRTRSNRRRSSSRNSVSGGDVQDVLRQSTDIQEESESVTPQAETAAHDEADNDPEEGDHDDDDGSLGAASSPGGRHHRLPIVPDLSDMDPYSLMERAVVNELTAFRADPEAYCDTIVAAGLYVTVLAPPSIGRKNTAASNNPDDLPHQQQSTPKAAAAAPVNLGVPEHMAPEALYAVHRSIAELRMAVDDHRDAIDRARSLPDDDPGAQAALQRIRQLSTQSMPISVPPFGAKTATMSLADAHRLIDVELRGSARDLMKTVEARAKALAAASGKKVDHVWRELESYKGVLPKGAGQHTATVAAVVPAKGGAKKNAAAAAPTSALLSFLQPDDASLVARRDVARLLLKYCDDCSPSIMELWRALDRIRAAGKGGIGAGHTGGPSAKATGKNGPGPSTRRRSGTSSQRDEDADTDASGRDHSDDGAASDSDDDSSSSSSDVSDRHATFGGGDGDDDGSNARAALLPHAAYNRGLCLAARDIAMHIGNHQARRQSTTQAANQFGKLTDDIVEYAVFGSWHSAADVVRNMLLQWAMIKPSNTAATLQPLPMPRGSWTPQQPTCQTDATLLGSNVIFCGVGWQRHDALGAVTVVLMTTGYQEVSYIRRHRNLPIVELKRCFAQGQMAKEERLYDLTFLPESYNIRAVAPTTHPLVCGAVARLVLECPTQILISCAIGDAQSLPGRTESQCFIDRIGTLAIIHAVLPDATNAKLVVFARHPSDHVYRKSSVVLLRPNASQWQEETEGLLARGFALPTRAVHGAASSDEGTRSPSPTSASSPTQQHGASSSPAGQQTRNTKPYANLWPKSTLFPEQLEWFQTLGGELCEPRNGVLLPTTGVQQVHGSKGLTHLLEQSLTPSRFLAMAGSAMDGGVFFHVRFDISVRTVTIRGAHGFCKLKRVEASRGASGSVIHAPPPAGWSDHGSGAHSSQGNFNAPGNQPLAEFYGVVPRLREGQPVTMWADGQVALMWRVKESLAAQ